MKKLKIKGRSEDAGLFGGRIEWIVPIKKKETLGNAVFNHLVKDNIRFCNTMVKHFPFVKKCLKIMPWALLSQDKRYQKACRTTWSKATSVKELEKAFETVPVILGFRNELSNIKISFIKTTNGKKKK